MPAVKVDVVGREPSRDLMERVEKTKNQCVTGFVEDIRPWTQGAGVAVVPLRVAWGTRLKINEAMALEAPVVSTTIGAEGLPLGNGEEILLADEPAGFANAVVEFLPDPDKGRALGLRAATKVRAEFGWDSVAENFEAFCQEAFS